MFRSLPSLTYNFASPNHAAVHLLNANFSLSAPPSPVSAPSSSVLGSEQAFGTWARAPFAKVRAKHQKLPLTALFTQQTSIFGFICSTKQKGFGTNLHLFPDITSQQCQLRSIDNQTSKLCFFYGLSAKGKNILEIIAHLLQAPQQKIS